GSDRVYGTILIADIARSDIYKPVAGKRRRNRNKRHPAELPEKLAVKIIGTDPAGTGRNDFGLQLVFPNLRSGPVTAFLTIDPPDLVASLPVQCDDKRLLFIVIHDIQPVLVKHRGSGCPPAKAGLERTPGF